MIYLTSKADKKEMLSRQIATLAISLHNPNHNGDKLNYIIDWVNSHPHFRRCYIDLADTLYRHNYMLGEPDLNEVQAYLKARKSGAKWLERHKSVLDNLAIPYEIIRWDKWLNLPEFSELFNLYKENYKNHSLFKNSVDVEILAFYARKGISKDRILPRERSHALNFLLEELACHTLMYREIPAAKIYPGRIPAFYKFVKENGLPKIDSPLKEMTYVRLIYHGLDKEEKSQLLKKGHEAA